MSLTLTKILIVSLSLTVLSACGGSSSGDGYDYIYVPELRQFDMIDTYGTNSEFYPVSALAISPYINSGEFDLFWTISSEVGYYTDIRINNIPSLIGSQLVFSDYCDPDFPCHDYQVLYCDYATNFDVTCENSFGDIESANIDHLISRIPQTLYFILDVCDGYGDYCEYLTIPVLME